MMTTKTCTNLRRSLKLAKLNNRILTIDIEFILLKSKEPFFPVSEFLLPGKKLPFSKNFEHSRLRFSTKQTQCRFSRPLLPITQRNFWRSLQNPCRQLGKRFRKNRNSSLRLFDLHKARKIKQKFLWHLVLIEQKVLQGIEFLARLGKISQELPCVKILAR